MKKTGKFLCTVVALVLSLSVVFGLSGCSTSLKTEQGVLTIRYFQGGYGDVWLQEACEKYQKENPGFKYKLFGDTNITNTVHTYLKSGENVADIYMTQGSPAWTEWVSLGYIENLESVYETEVNTSKGKRKIKDYMDKDILNKNYAQRIYGQGKYYPWMMPWSSIGISFAYNENILLSTKHTTDKADAWTKNDYWTAPPATVEEMAAYCVDVLARTDGVKPFSFGFADGMHWLEYIMAPWWAQYQGVYEENTQNVSDGDGAYYDFYNFENSEVWKQTGIQSAIDQWRTLIIDEKGNWKNTVPNIEEHTVQEAEKIFARGESAMALAGSFSYNEMKDYITNPDYVFKMMSMPLYGDGSKAMKKADGSAPATINYFTNEEAMFIPAKAVNKDLAKAFLAYLCNEDQLLNFTKHSGTMRPFDYNPLELEPDYEWTAYTRSYLDMYFASDVRLSAYPANKTVEEISPMYLYKRPSVYEGISVVHSMRSKTGNEIMIGKTANDTDSVYNKVKVKFNTWKAELGLD